MQKIKNNLTDLSIFGGTPIFNEIIHVGRPNLGNREKFIERINDIFDRNWLTNNGIIVQELERKLCNYLNVKHCIPICNGTIALEIAVRALDLTGEVIVPSFTFISTAHCLQWQEITPVFCDINPETHCIDPKRIEQLITPKTTGIIGVHLWGNACDVDHIQSIAQKHKLKVLYDAAHAFGCSKNRLMIGNFGNAEVFSFHATKFFNTFEGGAIATNDGELAEKIRLMKNFGFSGMDNVIYIGTNGKMNEVSAAMGLTVFESINDFISHNKHNYLLYKHEILSIPGINLHEVRESERHNFQYIVIEVDDKCPLSRDMILQILHAENIRVRRYFYPGCHKMAPYRLYYPNSGLLLPHTERMAQKIMCLPTGASMSKNEIIKICDMLRFIIANGREIHHKMNNINSI